MKITSSLRLDLQFPRFCYSTIPVLSAAVEHMPHALVLVMLCCAYIVCVRTGMYSMSTSCFVDTLHAHNIVVVILFPPSVAIHLVIYFYDCGSIYARVAGKKLRKVERNDEVKKQEYGSDVASILKRRIVMEFSDSESGGSDSEASSGGWSS